jgi:hypothetical protein
VQVAKNRNLKKKITRVVASAALVLTPFTAAIAFTAQPASASPVPPPGAAQPVRSYASSVTTMTYGINLSACFSIDSDPFGYILYYTKYTGWSYTDARNVSYIGWYQTWDNGWKTVAGPYTVDSVSHWYDCGLP